MELSGYIKSKAEVALRKFKQHRADAMLRRHADLWVEIQAYLQKTQSTGCGFIDYAALYREIRKTKPVEILECGTGVSTLVIAFALKENEAETGTRGRVTSMEEHDGWLQMARALLPERYAAYVDFVLSDTIEDRFSVFRGVRYANIPEREYDFVFVDGPKYQSPVDGGATFDFDFIHVLRNARKPVGGLVDKRLSTVFVLQQLLGPGKVKYSPVDGLGYVVPSNRDDLGNIATSISSSNFSGSFRLFGQTKLTITANRAAKA